MSSSSHKKKVTLLLQVVVLCLGQPLFLLQEAQAQTPQPSPTEKAFELYRAGEWSAAVQALSTVTQADPSNGRAWFAMGVSLHALAQYAKAVEAFLKAQGLNFNPSVTPYLVARSYARNGEKDRAFEWLGKAADVKFMGWQMMEKDADLASLREDPRYSPVATRLKALAQPCTAHAAYRAFDFFVGEWEQQDQTGRVVGKSRVKSELESCVIHEVTINPNGYAGHAFHYYDPTLGKWRQTYVDTRAGFSLWTGDTQDGKMLYTGEISSPEGSKSLGRSTFTRIDSNRIRQVFEVSSDSGKTWTVSWDGFYVRIK